MDLNKILKIGSTQVEALKDFVRKQERPLPLEVIIDTLCDKIKLRIAENLTFKVYDPRNNYFDGDNIYWEKNNFFGRVLERELTNREHDLIEVLWDTKLSGAPLTNYLRKNKAVRMFYLINNDREPGEVQLYRLESRRKEAESSIDYDDLSRRLLWYLKQDPNFVTWGGKWYLKAMLREFTAVEMHRVIEMIRGENGPTSTKDILDEVFAINEKNLKYPAVHFSLSYLLSTVYRHEIAYLSPVNGGEWSGYDYIRTKLPVFPDFLREPRISPMGMSPYVNRELLPQDIKYSYEKEYDRYDAALNTSPMVKEIPALPRTLDFWEYQSGLIILSNLERAYFPRQYKLRFVDQHTKKEFNCYYDFEKGIIGGLDKWVGAHMIPGGEMEFRDMGYGNLFELRWRQTKKSFDYSPLRYAIASDELIEDGTKVEVGCGINNNSFIDPQDYGELKDLFAWVRDPSRSVHVIVHEMFRRFGPKVKMEKLATYCSLLAGPWTRAAFAACASVIASDKGFLQGRGEKGNNIFHYEKDLAGRPETPDPYDIINASFKEIVACENEDVNYVGDEADLRVLLRDYGHWIRLKENQSEKDRVEELKNRAHEFRKSYLKKTWIKKASDDEFMEMVKAVSDEFMTIPINTKLLDSEKIAIMKKAVYLIFDDARKVLKSLETVLEHEGKFYLEEIPFGFYLRLAQIHDPISFMAINRQLEIKLDLCHLRTWPNGSSALVILRDTMELLKAFRRVRPAYDAFDFEHMLYYATDVRGPVYLDSILNHVALERVKVRDVENRRNDRVKEEKKRREMARLEKEAVKVQEEIQRQKEEIVAAAAAGESAATADGSAGSGSEGATGRVAGKAKTAKTKTASGSETAAQRAASSVSVFTLMDEQGITFPDIAAFLRPQLQKRLSKIHTSLRNIHPFEAVEADAFANTIYWYWVDWLWSFIVQQKGTVNIDLSAVPDIGTLDKKTVAIIGGIRDLMKEEGMEVNFDEIKYCVIRDLKSLIQAKVIKLKNYEMTNFDEVPVMESGQVQSARDAARGEKVDSASAKKIQAFKKLSKKVQACAKCPLIPNIKCNVFTDGVDGMGKITGRMVPNRAMKATDSPSLVLLGTNPPSDRAGYAEGASDNFFARVLLGSPIPANEVFGTFLAKCSALGDNVSRSMFDNCTEYFAHEMELISPKGIVVVSEEVGKHLRLRKGAWGKWKGFDIYFLIHTQDIEKGAADRSKLIKELSEAYATAKSR